MSTILEYTLSLKDLPSPKVQKIITSPPKKKSDQNWKKEFLSKEDQVFLSEKRKEQSVGKEEKLYQKIGQLQIEIDF